MRKRSWLAIGTAVLAAVTLGVYMAWPDSSKPAKAISPGAQPDTSPVSSSPVSTPYFYVTATGVTIMRDGKVVAQQAEAFSSGLSASGPNMPTWTLDGKYVFFLAKAFTAGDLNDDTFDPSGSELSSQTLVIIDVETGTIHDRPCPGCIGAGPAGGSRVVAYKFSDNRVLNQILSFDLSSGDPPNLFQVKQPKYPNWVRLVAGLPSGAVVAESNGQGAAYGGPESLHILGPDASIRDLGSTGSDATASPLVATSHSAYGPEDLAFPANAHAWACGNNQSIVLMDSQTGGIAHTDMSAAQPKGYKVGENGGVAVHDLWWDSKGTLYATIESWTCSPQVEQTPSSLWRLDGTKWVLQDAGPLAMARQLDNGKMLVLSSFAYGGPGGTLYLESGRSKTVVANNILAISTPGS